MNTAIQEPRPQDATPLAIGDFADATGLGENAIRELIDYGLLQADRLDLRTALAVREAARMQRDFDLDLFTTGLLASELLRIADLEAELRKLRAERPARVVYTEVAFTAVIPGQ